MSPRARVLAVTALAAFAAAASVVAIVAATDSSGSGSVDASASSTPARKGAPPLSLALGLRTDPQARSLRRALTLYDRGQRQRARAIFSRYGSLEARVGKAFASWPVGTVDRMTQLAGLHPRSSLVQLNFGTALVWVGRAGAEDAWRAAAEVEPDTPYAVTAGNLLYPSFAKNLPVFVPSFRIPASITALHPAKQLSTLERRARGGDVASRLLYGVALQRIGRPVSARRVYEEAARLAPTDDEAQVAAAVGRFDKAQPAEAFSRLGPLTRRFPHSASVRFHLGLLLLWSGEIAEAKRQLRLAQTVEPGAPLAREAAQYLDGIRRAGA